MQDTDIIILKPKINKSRANSTKKMMQNNKEQIQQRQKNYREANKEQINEKRKKNYQENKEKINQNVECECGCLIQKWHLSRHLKTAKHAELLKQKETKQQHDK